MKKLLVLLIAQFITTLAIAQPLKTVLIAYYSKSGHTLRLAKAVEKGVLNSGQKVVLKLVDEVSQNELLEADAIIVGSPVYNANIAPQVQEFINSWPFDGLPMKNKLGAAFVTAGGLSAGEETAQLSILRSMLVFGMLIVGGPDWTQAFGASAMLEELSLDDEEMDKIFWDKGEKLGERVGNLLKTFQ